MQTWNLEEDGQFMCTGKGDMYRERQYTDMLKPLRLRREYRNTGFKTKQHDWGNMTHLPLKTIQLRETAKEEQGGAGWPSMKADVRGDQRL